MDAASSKLDIFNKALGALGQKPDLTGDDLASPDMKTPVGYLTREYDDVRRGLMRVHPFDFCSDERPFAPVDSDGLVIRSAFVEELHGAFDSADEVWTHVSNDVVVSGESGAWLIGNAAGTKEYYTSTDAVSNPWDVSRWVAGDDGASPMPRVYPGQPRNHARLYEKPTDCLRVIGVLNPSSRRVDKQIRFKNLYTSYVGCDLADAVFFYCFDNEDVEEWDDLFVDAISKKLALAVYTDVKGSAKNKAKLEEEFRQAWYWATNVDSSESHENAAETIGRQFLDLD